MIQVWGEIHQLGTRGGSYINVLHDLTNGGVGVWGHSHRTPTYLLLRGHNWQVVVFDDAAWRDELLPGLIKDWAAEVVLEFPDMSPYECEVKE